VLLPNEGKAGLVERRDADRGLSRRKSPSFGSEGGAGRLATAALECAALHNRFFGFLFGYSGAFACEFPAAVDAPERLKPERHERRV